MNGFPAVLRLVIDCITAKGQVCTGLGILGWEPVQYSTTKANLFICFNNRKQSLDLFRDIFRGRRFRRDRMHRDRNLGTASWRDSEVGLWAAVPFSACGPHLGTGSGRGAYVAQGLPLPAAGAEWKQSGLSSDLVRLEVPPVPQGPHPGSVSIQDS